MAEAPVEVIRSAALAGIPHGFLGRRGGVSHGAVVGLDMGSRGMDPDDSRAEDVAENRRRGVEAVLPGARLVTVDQVHSPECVVADEWSDGGRPQADALVTDRPGLLLGILTADCAPVLLADRSAGVVGAAHAGWRGAHGGVLEAVVEGMEALGANREDMVAAIGPAIALESYEVDDRFREKFTLTDGRFFAPGREGHWFFDLEGYSEARLDAMGVGRVDCLGLDTYTDEERFFSFRRATHRGEPDYGRQISLIGLPR